MCVFFGGLTCTEQAVGGKWDMTNLIGTVEECAIIQLVTSTRLKKKEMKTIFKEPCSEEKKR